MRIRQKFIHTDWTKGQIIKVGLNLNIGFWSDVKRNYSVVLMFPLWFPFYGECRGVDFGSRLSLVLPVFAVGVFRENDKYLGFAFRIWRREIVREPFGWTAEESFRALWGASVHETYPRRLQEVTYALWSLRRRGWSVERIVERLSGNG
jgi:hypothetical protein